jgi:prepilin signal peptidase PulO-like enzyme (type II secretory pathway)
MTEHKIYAIPARFRRIENMHILLWLIKDACWAMNYRTMGMIMIIPTLFVAFFITWQTRHILSEFLHNLAVVFWIIANCTWMVGEFYGWDANLWGEYGLRQMALVPFCIGLLILIYYYLFLASKKSFQEKMYAKTEEAVKEELAD